MRQGRVGENEVKEKLTKPKGRAGRDTACPPLAISHGSRNDKFAFSASFHTNDTSVPAWAKRRFSASVLMRTNTRTFNDFASTEAENKLL